MRNLKKVLTLVLTLAMLLSVMVVGAGAATFGDQESITNKEAVDVCTTLNIIGGYEDGTFRPTGNVTRAEMSKMICVALNGGQEPTMGSGLIATFNDVAKDHWAAPYIEYCVSQGIVGGVGGGNFNPTGNITGTQAAKMLLCILGYNASIQGYVGSDYWETNINVDAAQKGLYAGLTNLDASAPLTRDQAAQMIWNALNAYEVEYKTTLVAGPDGTLTSKVTVQDRWNSSLTAKITLLEDKYEAKTFIGDFTGNKNVISTLKEGEIQVIGTGDYLSIGAVGFPANLDMKYVGEEVKVLYKDHRTEGKPGEPDSKDIIYGVFVTGTTEVLNVTSNDIEEVKGKDQIEVAGVKYDVAAPGDTTTKLVETNYGGEAATVSGGTGTAADATTVFKALAKQNGDSVKFILKDGEISKAYVVKSVLGTVTAVNSTKVTIDTLAGGSITIADNDVYSGIAKDDVVVWTKLYDTTLADAYVIVTKAETVSGTLSSFKGTDNVTIGDTSYDIYNAAALPVRVADETATSTFASSDIGEAFTLYLVNGYVGGAVQTSESANNYSLVIDKSGTGLGSALNPVKVIALGADGTKTTLTLSDKGAEPVIGDIITYTGSADNAKATVEAAKTTSASNTATTGYNKTNKTFNGVVTSADCVVFQCTDKAFASVDETGSFKASSIRNMKDFGVAASAYTVATNADGKVVAVFVGQDSTVATNTSDMVIGIVSKNNGVVKPDDTAYNVFTVASNDKNYTVKIEDTAEITDSLTVGDIVAFAPSSDDLYDDNTGFVVLSAADKYTKLGFAADGKLNVSGTLDTDFITIDGTKYGAATVAISEYDSNENLLTYFTALKQDNNLWVLDADSGESRTLSLASDATIVYVDVDKDSAGEDMGISLYNRQATSATYNAIILVDSDGVISHIVIETSGEDSVYAQNS